MSEIIEYEPVRKRDPRGSNRFWLVMIVGVILSLFYFYAEGERIKEARIARDKSEKAEKLKRRHDAAVLRELEDLNDATNRARREAAEAAEAAASRERLRKWQAEEAAKQ